MSPLSRFIWSLVRHRYVPLSLLAGALLACTSESEGQTGTGNIDGRGSDRASSAHAESSRAQVRFLEESQCLDVDLGGPYSCAAEDDWIARATASCNVRGLELLGFAVTDPCGNGWFRYVDGACCPSGWAEPDNVAAVTAARLRAMLPVSAPSL